MNDVMAALTTNGVAQKDIQTQYYNIQQTTTWDNNKQEQIVTGYQINNVVSIKVRGVDTDATRAGTVIDAVTLAGGDLTRINSIQFTVDDPTADYDQAREKAMADAKDTATQLAKLAGVTLGKPISISESNISVPQYVPVYCKRCRRFHIIDTYQYGELGYYSRCSSSLFHTIIAISRHNCEVV